MSLTSHTSATHQGVTGSAGHIIGSSTSITCSNSNEAIIVSASLATIMEGSDTRTDNNIIHRLSSRISCVNGAAPPARLGNDEIIARLHAKNLFSKLGVGSGAIAATDGTPQLVALAPDAPGHITHSRIDVSGDIPSNYLSAVQNALMAHKITFSDVKMHFEPLLYAAGVILGHMAIHGHVLSQSQWLGVAGVSLEERCIYNPTRGTVLMNSKDCNLLTTTSINAVYGAGPVEWLHTLGLMMGATVSDDSALINNNGQRIIIGGTQTTTALLSAVNYLFDVGAALQRESSYAYAFDMGLAAVITVVGETEEGAWFRDVIRCGRFGVPYGVFVKPDTTCAGHLPSTENGARSMIYARSLILAGCFSASDPCLDVGGAIVPTLMAMDETMVRYGGDNSNVELVLSMVDDYSSKLLPNVCKLFKKYAECGNGAREAASRANSLRELRDAICFVFLQAIDHDPTPGQQNTTAVTRADMSALTCYIADMVNLPAVSMNRVFTDLEANDYMNGNMYGVDFDVAANAIPAAGGNPAVPAVLAAVVADASLYNDVRTYNRSEVLTLVDKSLSGEAGGFKNFVTCYETANGYSTGGSVVGDILQAQFTVFGKRFVNNARYCRHLNTKHVQLYSWIEATGLVPRSAQVPMMTYYNASFADIGVPTSYPAFTGEFNTSKVGEFTQFSVKGSVCLRNLHFANHYRMHTLDGLATLTLSSKGTGNMMANINPAMDEVSIEKPIPLSSLTWSLGSMALPFASEGLIISDGSTYMYRTSRPGVARAGYNPALVPSTPNHMYDPGLYSHGVPNITYSMGKFLILGTPTPINDYGMNARKRNITSKSTARVRALHHHIHNTQLGKHSSRYGEYAYTHATIVPLDVAVHNAPAHIGAYTTGNDGDGIGVPHVRAANTVGIKATSFSVGSGDIKKDKNNATSSSNINLTKAVDTTIALKSSGAPTRIPLVSGGSNKYDPAGPTIIKQAASSTVRKLKPQFQQQTPLVPYTGQIVADANGAKAFIRKYDVDHPEVQIPGSNIVYDGNQHFYEVIAANKIKCIVAKPFLTVDQINDLQPVSRSAVEDIVLAHAISSSTTTTANVPMGVDTSVSEAQEVTSNDQEADGLGGQ